ncbi:MAG: cation:proton antiporter [Bacteroidia bacterium]|nr:cation:proton antiporter [Bacteroidia bacterium]
MNHPSSLIADLALILGAAAVIILLFKWLKQPVVLGYIIAGLLVGPNFKLFPSIIDVASIRIWADIGVIFLLFGLGLEFSFRKLVKVGGVAVLTAFTGVGLTMLLGFAVGKLMGWANMDCLFLGGILAIASTTIIIRAFEELNVKTQKFTSIVMGVLVVEDLVAVVLMVLLSTVAISRKFQGVEMLFSVLKLIFFLVLWFVSGIFFLPTILKKMKGLMNDETLLIVSLALCFLMVILATKAGFSAPLGAFIMGSVLAETTKAEKIEHLVSSVKNLFGAIFFVSVGMLIEPDMLFTHAGPIIAGTLVLLIGKPIFVTLGALATGQPLKISVQTGMSLSQIGEFSFIIATLGITLDVTSDYLYPVAVAVSVLTTFTTPFMIRLSEPVYTFLNKALPPKWISSINNYSHGAEDIVEISDWRKLIRFYIINVLVFSVVIISIILLSINYFDPLISGYKLHKIITLILTLAMLAPFLWALAFRRTQRQAYANVWTQTSQRGPLIALLLSRVLLAIFYLGFFFNFLFSTGIAIVGVIISCVVLSFFYNRIKRFYGKIEVRFLMNLNGRELDDGKNYQVLIPWDTHPATFNISASSDLAGKTLEELGLRELFGINIAVIHRGEAIINVPSRLERLFPGDEISVIGTDEQLKKLKISLEKSVHENFRPKREVSLQHFTISQNSKLIGKNIRESDIRNLSKGLVVGIERNGLRILNPESGFVFNVNDKVWIVGDEKRIRILNKESN